MTGMRVAYVLGTVTGGTGQHVAMLARGAQERGLAVTVHGPAQAGRRFFAAQIRRWARTARPAVAFVPVEIADRPRPARDAAAVLRLRRLLAGTQPEVVHAHGLRAGAVAAFALAGAGWRRRHRCALVVTVHNAPPAAGPAGAVYAVLERIVARRADAVTCVSGDLAARMRAPGRGRGRPWPSCPPRRPGRRAARRWRRPGPTSAAPASRWCSRRAGSPPEGLRHAAGGRGQLAGP